jgi:hypothetical protein
MDSTSRRDWVWLLVAILLRIALGGAQPAYAATSGCGSLLDYADGGVYNPAGVSVRGTYAQV